LKPNHYKIPQNVTNLVFKQWYRRNGGQQTSWATNKKIGLVWQWLNGVHATTSLAQEETARQEQQHHEAICHSVSRSVRWVNCGKKA